MAKGLNSNREKRKPKADKKVAATPAPVTFASVTNAKKGSTGGKKSK
jgi:hypothetical protein